MKHLVIVLLAVSTTNAAVRMQDDWVDPHDMNTNVKQKYLPKLKKSTSSSSVDDNIMDPMPDICMSHLKRVVSLLMNSAHVDKRDLDSYHGHIRFNIDPSDYEFLVNFAKNDLTLDNLRKLDTVLSGSFRRSYIDGYLDTLETFQLNLYSIVMNLQNLWLLGAVCLLYCVYQLFKNNFSLVYIFKYLIFILVIVDFGCRYNHSVEEAEKHNLGVVYSPNCDTSKMSWAQYSKFVFSITDCEKRTVTPLDVFLLQIKNLIIIPMQAFGTGMGGFGKNMFVSLPWGLNLIIWPIMLVFTLMLLLFAMTIFTQQAIEFNIFHVVKCKFGGGAQKENTITMPVMEKIMDKMLHRPTVQNVHVGLPSMENRKSDTKKDARSKKSSTSKEVPKETPRLELKHRSKKIQKQRKEEEHYENPADVTFLEQISKVLNIVDTSIPSEADNTSNNTDKSRDSKKAET